MTVRTLALAFALLVLSPAAAAAGRPLATEDTATLDQGATEVELSATHARGAGAKQWSAGVSINHGLVPRLEIKLESALLVLNAEGQDTHAGAGDSIAGAKYRFLDEAPAFPALLGVVVLRLPTGDPDRELGRPGVDVTALAALSKILGPVTVTANAGPTFVTGDRRQDFWTVGTAVEYRAGRRLTLVGEAISEFPRREGEPRLLIRAGAVVPVTSRITLDGAVASGLTRDTPDVIVTIGITIGIRPLRP